MKAEVPGIDPVAVGSRIRLTRDALDMTQQAFGRPAGMNKNSLSNIETGRNYPSIPNLVALCEAHDLTLDWICAGHYKGLRYELVEAIKVEIAKAAAKPRRIKARAIRAGRS